MNPDLLDGVPADCSHCRHAFTVSKNLAGGIANCPHCGKAVEVAGTRDPLWRAAQLGAGLLAGAGGVTVGAAAGPVAGSGAAAGAAAVLWLISRAM